MDTSHTSSVTFLFADPGDSLLLWEQHPAAMQAASPRFRAALQQSITAQGGEVFNISNDTLQAAFYNAPDAVSAALQAQHALIGWRLGVAAAPTVGFAHRFLPAPGERIPWPGAAPGSQAVVRRSWWADLALPYHS